MSEGKRRIPELDGLRALLIFLVSWYHIWQQSWWTPYIGNISLDFLVRSGYVHVDATVLMSSFLLFLPWARTMLNGTPEPDYRLFYRRRLIRVYPSYLFILLAVLFGIAIPFGLYPSANALVKDVATHLTFTFNFFPDTYIATPLGAACWTLAVEVQAYLLFPWIAHFMVRHPVRTASLLCMASWGFRAWCVWTLSDYSLVVNQLVSFLDVYALGMLLSLLYTWADQRIRSGGKNDVLRQAIATAAAFGAVCLLVLLLKRQAASPGYTALQRGQLIRRLPFAAAYGLLMISLPFAVRPVRFLFGNRAMGFLAAVSMNYYLIHQTVAVHLRRIGVPYSISETPNVDRAVPWQHAYTWLTFGLSLALAALVTWLIEKPCAAWLRGHFEREDRRAEERMRRLKNRYDAKSEEQK